MKYDIINRKWHVGLLIVVCIVTFFINNSTFHPDIMESRNIVTAREMVYDGHWLVPTMNGDLRLEKPPLPTWIAAVSELMSPDNIRMQRAMAGVAAMLLVFFFYFFGREVTGNEDFAWISALILCTSYNIVLMGRTASWDIYCHAFMMGAIYYMYRMLKRKDHTWQAALWAGVLLALSFLSKGPVSFYALLLPFVIALMVCMSPLERGRWKQILLMIAICITVGCSWYVYIFVFHSDIAQYIWHKESAAWGNHNVRPWYYYSTFFLEMGVWSLAILSSIIFPVWMKRLKNKQDYLFFLIWLAVQLVLLSLFPEKKKRYLLPALIPCSYLVGMVFCYWKEELHRHADRLTAVFYAVNTYTLSVVCLVLPIAGYIFLYRPGYLSLSILVLMSILLIGIVGWLFVTSWHREPFFFVYGIVALFFVGEIGVMPYLKNLTSNTEMKSIGRTRYLRELNALPFYYVKGQEMRIEIIYEAHRKIRPLDVNNVQTVCKTMPFVLLTHDRAEKVLPPSVKKHCSLKWIDCYDNNRHPKGTNMYKQLFVYNVTIVTPRVVGPR